MTWQLNYVTSYQVLKWDFDLIKMHFRFESLFLTLFWFCTTGSDGLEDVRLDAPKYIRHGEELNLSCQYDIETKSLYAIKFYKGREEFYRYVPKESPPQKTFPLRGVQVDVRSGSGVILSSERKHQVILVNTSQETSGKYQCVVSAETTFQTLSDDQDILVVSIGYDSPKLFVNQLEYSQGDIAKANCSIERTVPQVNISWFIDDIEVSKSKPKIFLVPDSNDPMLSTTISTLDFELPESPFLQLRCTGQLYDIYFMSSAMTIRLKPRRLSMMSTSPDTLTTRLNETARGIVAKPHRTNKLLLASAQFALMTFTTIVIYVS